MDNVTGNDTGHRTRTENTEEGQTLRRYSIRLPKGEATVMAEAITFALSGKGAWATNVDGAGYNPWLPGVVEADVRDLTAGEEPWGHDENAAEGFEPETFSAVVALVERGGKSGKAKVAPLLAVSFLRLRGWSVQTSWTGPDAVEHKIAHVELGVMLVGLTEDDVDEVAKLMGWQG